MGTIEGNEPSYAKQEERSRYTTTGKASSSTTAVWGTTPSTERTALTLGHDPIYGYAGRDILQGGSENDFLPGG